MASNHAEYPFYEPMSYDEYLEQFSKEERRMFTDYLLKHELADIKAKLNPEMTVENVMTILNEFYEPINTHADDNMVEKYDKNGIDCWEMDFSKVDWEGLFEYYKNGGTDVYNIHSYQDYGVVYLDFTKDGLNVSLPSEQIVITEEHIEEDFDEFCEFSKIFVEEAIEEIKTDRANGVVFEWDEWNKALEEIETIEKPNTEKGKTDIDR